MADRVLQVNFVGNTTELGKSVDNATGKFASFGKGLAAVGAAGGAAMGGALAVGLANAISTEAANAKLGAQLGAGSALAADAGKVAGELYGNAYGESLGEVNNAVKTVLQSGALMEDATTEQIQSITGQAMSLATTFDQDIGGSMNAVAQMMRTGLAPDAQTALDILARGFQQGGDKAGDLLDTMNEYGTQFRKLGLDGTAAMGLIGQGLQAGARDADVVADAIKEFSIRAIDGSKLTGEAYAALGLDAQKMTAQIARGGPEASAGLQVVLDRLRGMQDPVAQSAAAVGLFGTQAEDLGAALFSLDPSKAVAAMGTVAGAAAKIDETMGATAQAKITSMQRAVEGWTMSLVATDGPIGSMSAGVMSFGPMALEYGAQLGMMAVATRGMGFASIFTGNAMKVFWAAAFGPIGLVVAAVALLAGVIIYNWDTIKGWTIGTFNAIVGFLSWAWDMIVFKFDQGVAFVKGFISWFGQLGSLFGAWIGHAKDIAIFKFHELVNWVKGLPGRILGALGNFGSMLYNSGVELVQGFLNGIKAKWDGMVSWVKQGMTNLRNLWPFSPAKTGPFSGRGYVTYSGRALTSDFAASIRRGIPRIVSATRSVLNAARGGFSASATVGRSAVVSPASPAPSAVTVVVDSAGSRLDDMMVEFLNRALRERGLDGVA